MRGSGGGGRDLGGGEEEEREKEEEMVVGIAEGISHGFWIYSGSVTWLFEMGAGDRECFTRKA